MEEAVEDEAARRLVLVVGHDVVACGQAFHRKGQSEERVPFNLGEFGDGLQLANQKRLIGRSGSRHPNNPGNDAAAGMIPDGTLAF